MILSKHSKYAMVIVQRRYNILHSILTTHGKMDENKLVTNTYTCIYIYISRLYSKYFYLAFQDISLKLYKIMMVFLTAYLGGGSNNI